MLTCGDVVFTQNGLLLRVRSLKTIQYHKRTLDIPVLAIPGSPFCASRLMKEHFSRFPGSPDSMLFYKDTNDGPRAVLYRELLDFLKGLVEGAGLNPSDVGLHSVRRSGCAFLHSINVPLENIKCVGDWKSIAVLSYLITPVEREMLIKGRASQALLNLSV